MQSNVTAGLTVAVLALALVIGGLGAGLAISAQKSPVTTTVTSTSTGTNSSAPFVVTLVVTTDSIFNSSALDQPAFFVLGPNGLESSAAINVPAHRLIELVIVNYDDGNASMVQSGVNVVTGTQGNKVLIASNDNINSTQGPSGIIIRGGESVSSISPDMLAHSFTVPSLNLNIPIQLSSTVVSYFTINQPGTFTWECLTLCGDSAMSTPGWMTGSLVAS